MEDDTERKARNEAIFREANEKIAAVRTELTMVDGKTPFFCECDDPACRETVSLDLAEYEEVRSSPATFVVVPGHDDGSSRVVAAHSAYHVIEKQGVARRVAVETDPRAGDE